jgi:NADPH:quinone reductase
MAKAIATYQYLPTDDPHCFEIVEIPKPQPTERDLLVKIKAIAVNPVDYKIRSSIKEKLSTPKILGWDAAGIVEAVGENTSLFQVGDEVYYAGSVIRLGSYSEYQLVDERIVGKKPGNLSFTEAAALPLTTITAWEALFEKLGIESNSTQNQNSTILIINGAGGVGSIAIQLAKVAGLKVIATASRYETVTWCRQLGADECINHHKTFQDELNKLGVASVDYILCLHDTDLHWQNMADVIKPQGKICSIVGNREPLDLNILKDKSVTFAWEFMFTKSKHQTADLASQGELLNGVSQLCDSKIIKTTLKENFGSLNPYNLAKAHARLESGTTIGKIVLSEMAEN